MAQRISKQLRGLYFVLVTEIYKDDKSKFLMISEKFIKSISEIMHILHRDGIATRDTHQYQEFCFDIWRRYLNLSLGLPISVADKSIDTIAMCEIVNKILEHANFVGVDLNFFYEQNPNIRKELKK